MEPGRAELKAAACWVNADHVAGDPVMTAFKRRARYHQAQWRSAQGHEMGTHPLAGGPGAFPLGSRLPLPVALATGANFLSPTIRAAVDARLGAPEDLETLYGNRLHADLLSSMPMCFNLFGELAADLASADNAVRRWWPDAPGAVDAVRFEWSPRRGDLEYLGNRSAFDVAFTLGLGAGSRGVVGVETKYHEHPVRLKTPPADRLKRYVEVAERSGVFVEGAIGQIVGGSLQQIWLDHLLVLSMLQHPRDNWSWGRFVLVHPAGNVGFARLATEYAELLRDTSTFEVRTVESLLATPGCLPASTVDAFRARYLWDS